MRKAAGAFAENKFYENISLIITYIVVFIEPMLFLITQGFPFVTNYNLDDILPYINIFGGVFFVVDILLFTVYQGTSYWRSAGSWINLLAIIATGASFTDIGGFGLNPRVLRLLRTVRVVAKISLTQRPQAGGTVLGAEAMRRFSDSDAWYALIILMLMSFVSGVGSGEYESWADSATEIVVYVGFIAAMRWKAWSNQRQIEEVFVGKLYDATQAVISQMRKIPGLENADQVIDDHSQKLESDGKTLNEISVIIDSLGIILTNLRRFISGRTFEEAKGEVVLPPETDIALMFTDVAGFSKMTEALQERIIPILREYLGAMVQGVDKFGGDIDKFIGDAVFAYFLNPEKPGESANAAFDAALEMSRLELSLWETNATWRSIFSEKPEWRELADIRTRIGLHHGNVVAGPVGSDIRADSTLIGDHVNLAARIEGLNRKYGTYFLVTEAFYFELSTERQARCRRIDRVTVAGRENSPLIVHTIDIHPLEADAARTFQQGLDLYLDGDWQAAYEVFSATQAEIIAHGGAVDGPISALINRIEESKSSWRRAAAELHRLAPSIVGNDIVLAVDRELENHRFEAPDDWKGYWSHDK